jgi:uncharacterized protein (DUF1778 family)
MTVKDKRLELRVTSEQKQLIEQAAALEGRSVTDFSTQVIVEEAHEVIRREHQLALDAELFDAFQAELDKPARVVPGLADLYRRGTVFGE